MPKTAFKFTQIFGDKQLANTVNEADLITALSFDKRGNHLAVGDESGRLIVFEQGRDSESNRKYPEYKYCAEWQSYLKDFDYLKSIDVNPRITSLEWLEPSGKNQFILAANEKKIRLWKLSDKRTTISEKIRKREALTTRTIQLPKLRLIQKSVFPSLKRTFSALHNFHINYVSASPDGETFLSADDLTINLWNLETPSIAFNILNMKPDNINNVSEVITKSKFHPSEDSQFIYATKKGSVHFGDLRVNIKHLSSVITLQDSSEDYSNIFHEITSSITDASISPDGRFVYARDYFSLKVWDLSRPRRPYSTIKLYDAPLVKQYQLYETDSMLDKFSLGISPCSRYAVTGGHNNFFQVVYKKGNASVSYEVNYKKKTVSTPIVNSSPRSSWAI
jgi:serine/threonine-protein phosphatase 2A regulatory subunit B